MSGVQIHLAGADPASVEAAADELKARFGRRFSVTHRSRRKNGSLTLRGVLLVDVADPLDATVPDLLRRTESMSGG
jgi:hypothetical protein